MMHGQQNVKLWVLSFRVTEETFCGGIWIMTPFILEDNTFSSNMRPA
jgi:hypothetical protein